LKLNELKHMKAPEVDRRQPEMKAVLKATMDLFDPVARRHAAWRTAALRLRLRRLA